MLLVDAQSAGVTRERLEGLDLTRAQGLVEFHDAPAVLLAAGHDADAALSRLLDVAVLALAAEESGVAEAVMKMSLDYAKLREQFGRPIGSFQAIQHKLADMALDLERIKACVDYLLRVLERDDGADPGATSLVKVFCAEATFRMAAENIQIHGGIGFTWEHDAHLYFKRARASQGMFGDPAYHRERVARAIGLQ